MGTTRAAKLWCLLCLLDLLSLLSLLYLLLWLPLRLSLLQNNTSSLKHDSLRWTTMTTLNLLDSAPLY